MDRSTGRAWRILLIGVLVVLVGSSCAQVDQITSIKLKRKHLRFDLPQTSRIFASNGRLITTFHGEENRTIVKLRSLPDHVWRAIVAIEDERFFEHHGVDLKAVLRAAIENVTSGEVRQGGSTITQQYVKNMIISPEGPAAQTLKRKIREAALARQLERRLTKREILSRYVNAVYFGNGAYGVDEAARTYFRMPARRLKPWQAATVAGLIRNPSVYDPYNHARRAKKRRNLVLDKMKDLDWLPDRRVERMLGKKLDVKELREKRYSAPYFIDYVKRLLFYHPRFRMLGRSPAGRSRALFQEGLRIYTTVDLAAQRRAERAVKRVLPRRKDPHASVVSVDPRNGRIFAMVGGRDFFAPRRRDPFAKLNLAVGAQPKLGSVRSGKEELGRAPGTGRQAGSAFKPFALVQALRERVPLYRTFAAPSCRVFPNADNGGPWRVCNYGGGSYGRVSLLEATVNSINVVYAKLILEVGASDVVRTARTMGIRTELAPVNSAVLGTNVVNPLGMASAYSTLAAGGMHYEPVAITRIEDAEGKVLYKLPKQTKRRQEVIDPSVAYLATNTLEQAVQRGTGTGAIIGRPVAGKTGTAQDYRDAWFVGFTPQRATAVWVGYPEGSISMKTYCFEGPARCRSTRIQVTGGSWPADIWRGFMSAEMRDMPVRGFSAPSSGLLRVVIDTRRNCLATGSTPASARETVIVLQGTNLPDPCPRPAPEKKDGDKDERGKSKSNGDDRGKGRRLGHDKSRGRR